jgi:putative membrane protein
MSETNGVEKHTKHVARGVVAGIAGGLVASWVMNVFMANGGPKITQAVENLTGDKGGNGAPSQAQAEQQEGAGANEPKEDATMKAADAIVSTVTGGRHLSFEEKQKAGPVVHYAFGALMGGAYGALAEYSSTARAGFGTGFGSALFACADLVAVPALNLSGSAADAPVSSLANPFAAHLVYGAITEGVRRVIRAIL